MTKVYEDNKFSGYKTVTKELQDYLFEQAAETKSVVRDLIEEKEAKKAISPYYFSKYSAEKVSTTPIITNPLDRIYFDGDPQSLITQSTPPISALPQGTFTPKENTEKKDTNPKDAVGIRKVAFSTVPQTVIAEVGVGMMEGARKYGRHNWRAAEARASVYFDATLRHLYKWYEGEDIDPDSGLSHIAKAITSLVVLRDAMINDKWNDDRPPKIPENFWNEIQARVDEIFIKYPTSLDPVTEWSMRNKLGGNP